MRRVGDMPIDAGEDSPCAVVAAIARIMAASAAARVDAAAAAAAVRAIVQIMQSYRWVMSSQVIN